MDDDDDDGMATTEKPVIIVSFHIHPSTNFIYLSIPYATAPHPLSLSLSLSPHLSPIETPPPSTLFPRPGPAHFQSNPIHTPNKSIFLKKTPPITYYLAFPTYQPAHLPAPTTPLASTLTATPRTQNATSKPQYSSLSSARVARGRGSPTTTTTSSFPRSCP